MSSDWIKSIMGREEEERVLELITFEDVLMSLYVMAVYQRIFPSGTTLGDIVDKRMAECDHDWVPWSGKQRCRKCGATQ